MTVKLLPRHYALARVGLACWAAFSGLNAQAATRGDVEAASGATVPWTGNDLAVAPIKMTPIKSVQQPG